MLVGSLLVAGFAISAIGGGVAYGSAGYRGEFWKLALDDKLDHVHGHRRGWWWLSIGQLIGLVVLTGGFVGLVSLESDAGQSVLAHVSLGVYLVALIAWMIGLTFQTMTIPRAATQRADSGSTPDWIHAFWDAGYLGEAIWVIAANLAYLVIGIAILRSGQVASWAGWVAVALGGGIPVAVVATRQGFPELSQLVPFALGISLIIEALKR